MNAALGRIALTSALIFAFVAQGAAAVAGTTGGLNGTVSDAAKGTPLAGVKVTVTSPSQIATTTTDAAGRFTFVSLAPDEYTLSLELAGYEPVSVGGVAVFADSQQALTFTMKRVLQTIATVTSRTSSLVKPGTTADVYSVNAEQQARLSALGGGGNLNSAYSAIASVPGAYVPGNQNGYLQAIHVRGGDSYEIGFEFDGIPVNRAFDNYPSGLLSSVGQLELQVYTGATPAGAEAQGLAGFINQVIKSGTYPGYATADLGIGSPIFYHNVNVEVGGATPDRLFSYYAGIGGYNQQHRYVDQFGGADYVDEFGQALGTCPAPSPSLEYGVPSSCYTNGARNVAAGGSPGYVLGPIGFGTGAPVGVAARTTVANVHFGIQHRHDALRDDVQVLYENDRLYTTLASSVNDEGYNNYVNTVSPSVFGYNLPYYVDGYQYNGALGQYLPSKPISLVTPYFYPATQSHSFEGPIPDPFNQRDENNNGQAIFKLQYQKNFSSSAFLRVYGYTYYSDWLVSGPMLSLQDLAYYDAGDYEINNHTRGLSATFTDQLSPQHLLSAEASYTPATGARIYDEQMFDYADSFAVAVNPRQLGSGTCYNLSDVVGGEAQPTTCSDGLAGGVAYGGSTAAHPLATPTFASLAGIYGCTIGISCTLPTPTAGIKCGGGPCAYYVVENGAYGENNNVTPRFYGYSITDEWRPSDSLVVNAGVRVDNYNFIGGNTDTGPARAFWFNAFNQDTCYDTQTLTLVDRTALIPGNAWSTNAQKPCSAFGKQYVNANMQNTPGNFDYNIVQPRIGATYTVDRDTVLRASYGKYNEQPSSAYEQYNALQQNLPDFLAQFYPLGFTSPGHEVRPPVSYNSDFSIEHHFKGTDLSFKLSPFLRQTQDEEANFYLNYATGFTSGLNGESLTSRGFEFALQKGDFNRNGFSGQLSFAYTYATVKYNTLPNGTTLLSSINSSIAEYNAYTKACAKGGSSYGQKQYGAPVCGSTSTGEAAAPCYVPVRSSSGSVIGANPAPCTAAGAYANPYWNSPAFALEDPTASYLPYSYFPGPVGSGVNAYNYPYVGSLIVNYKHNKLSITPSLQYQAGNRYGAPLTTPGIDPAAGCSALTSAAGGARYPYGAPGGAGYGVTTQTASGAAPAPCASSLLPGIPDPYTGQFDAIGGFREPAQLLGHLRIGYDLSPRVSLTVTLTNLLQTCFGGQQTRFTYFMSNNVCLYTNLIGGPSTPPVGNAYNPGDNVQTFLRYPYEPAFGVYNDLSSSINQPFNAYFAVKVKI